MNDENFEIHGWHIEVLEANVDRAIIKMTALEDKPSIAINANESIEIECSMGQCIPHCSSTVKLVAMRLVKGCETVFFEHTRIFSARTS